MKRRMLASVATIILLTTVFIISISVNASPTEIHVPTDYSTIQEAIDNASVGDTIIVAEGIYAGAIVDKNVTIIGGSGGASIITSGVPYKDGSSLYTAFRLVDEDDDIDYRNRITMVKLYRAYWETGDP